MHIDYYNYTLLRFYYPHWLSLITLESKRRSEGGRRDRDSEGERDTIQIDEARHCTKLIKTESFCFSELTRNESGRELICPQGMQLGATQTHTHTHTGRCNAECRCHSYWVWRHIMRQSLYRGVCACVSYLSFHYITTLTYTNILYNSVRERRQR